jgi:NADH dehydrogenase
MRKTDSYTLKNVPLDFKLLSTGAVSFSIALLSWSWYTSLSVLKFNRPSDMCRLLGDDLWALAHYKTGLFSVLLFFQAVAYGTLYITARVLFKESALRRRMKSLLLAVATGLFVIDQFVWFTAPFLRLAQQLAGYIGLASAVAMIILTLPPLWQMWFHKRWQTSRPARVVIVGGGFAGMYTALGLDNALGYHRDLEIVLVDKKNFFLFPPLLPSAAVGTIETRQVTQSYRRIFETTNVQYKKATVTCINPQAKLVQMHVHLDEEDTGTEPTAAEVKLPYDYLVLAPGATNQTFNTKGAEEHALFVKELSDAIKIRDRIIDSFEKAAVVQDEEIRRELLRFAIVGGGPTGIEIATEIQDLIHEVLLKRYPEIHKDHPEVYVIQSGPQVLPGWPEKVVHTTTRQLKRLGIQLVLNNRVTEIRHNAVVLKDGPPISARTILWCAGVKPAPLLTACSLPQDKSGRIAVDPYLRVPGFENIFVLGDSALCIGADGKPLPPLGQVAFQQGDCMAANLARLLRGEPIKPFKYFNFGSLVSVGEHYAAVDLLGVKLTGFIGWFVWRSLYLAKMIGLSTKIRIMTDWTLDLFIERSIAQLGEPSHDAPEPAKTPELAAP